MTPDDLREHAYQWAYKPLRTQDGNATILKSHPVNSASIQTSSVGTTVSFGGGFSANTTASAEPRLLETGQRIVIRTEHGDIVIHPDGWVDIPTEMPTAAQIMWDTLSRSFQGCVERHVQSEARVHVNRLQRDLEMADIKAYEAVTKVLAAFAPTTADKR